MECVICQLKLICNSNFWKNQNLELVDIYLCIYIKFIYICMFKEHLIKMFSSVLYTSPHCSSALYQFSCGKVFQVFQNVFMVSIIFDSLSSSMQNVLIQTCAQAHPVQSWSMTYKYQHTQMPWYMDTTNCSTANPSRTIALVLFLYSFPGSIV